MYLIYAVAMVLLHPKFIYPFGENPLVDTEFTAVVLDDTQGHLYVTEGDPKGVTVLYFMGNVGSLAYSGMHLNMHRDFGYRVAALGYPGGGGISGQPSERLLKAQALESYDWLATQHEDPIVVHGYSLGTGLALHVAANRDVEAIILDAPYARMCDLMTQASWLPACYLPGVQRWNSLVYADKIDAPVLVLHGVSDDLIPISHGQKLVLAMSESENDVIFAPLAEANHNNIFRHPLYVEHVVEFLQPITQQ
jgi:esterase/lipase